MSEFSDVIRPQHTADLPSELPTALVKAGNAFAVDLWMRTRLVPGNLAVSPASLYLALAMTLAGARGATREQMRGTLRLSGSLATHQAAAALLHRWNDPDRTEHELRVINRLFGDRSHQFEQQFLDLIRKRYGAPLELVDFRHDPKSSRARINRWVAAQTAQRIRNLLPPAAPDEVTSLVLANVVYFLGKWACPFGQSDTRNAIFHDSGRETLVPTMHQTRDFPYFENETLRLLTMPYQGGYFEMTILLPRDRDGLAEMEDQLSSSTLVRWLDAKRLRSVNVAIPRFTIDPDAAIQLKPALVAMGMPGAFDRHAADFTGISNPSEPEDRLFIGDVVHKAFVKTDESGTEATAASAVREMMLGVVEREEPRLFRADHPFLFLIREIKSEMILFMGRVSEPKS